MKTCPVCGTEMKDDAKYCPTCGAKQELEEIELVQEEPKVEIPVPEQPDTSDIHLTLEGALDAQLAKTEVEMDALEEDLSDVLQSNDTQTQTQGNAQAQAQVVPPVNLVIPEETKAQEEAKKEVDDWMNQKEDKESKTQQLIRELEEQRRKEAEQRKAAASSTQTNAQRPTDNKFVLALSYLSVLGWAIAYFLTGQKMTAFSKKHFNRALVLNIFALIMRFIGSGGGLLSIVFSVLWFWALYLLITGSDKELPIVDQITIFK